MQPTTPINENPSPNRTAGDALFDELKLYHDIGLDTDGRAHLFDPDAREIVVTETDRRGKGVRNADVTRTIEVPDGQTVDDYCRFVATEVDDLHWRECDWQPEAV